MVTMIYFQGHHANIATSLEEKLTGAGCGEGGWAGWGYKKGYLFFFEKLSSSYVFSYNLITYNNFLTDNKFISLTCTE